jgi:hypothetical protein
MLTQLDQDIARVMDALTAPGGMLQTVPLPRFGRELPMLAAAPRWFDDERLLCSMLSHRAWSWKRVSTRGFGAEDEDDETGF